VPPLVFFLSLALLFSSASEPVRHFTKTRTNEFPRAVVEHDFCRDKGTDCWQNFLTQGSVWAGDIHGDGANELLVFPGYSWQGSGGSWYFLYEKRGKDWVSLTKDPGSQADEDGWFTPNPRFEILPAVRDGFHDLRVAVDVCVKWDGGKYVQYDPADYHRLNPGWFNRRDSHDAEIFWAIQYAGQDKVIFKPQWFPITRDDFVLLGDSPRSGTVSAPRLVGVELDDPKEHLCWYALHKGGVWAVRGDQAFFLAPQVSEAFESVEYLKIDGDWLLGSGVEIDESHGARPSIRYNRRTHELILDRHDYAVDSPDK
jgi:hypothetical protein